MYRNLWSLEFCWHIFILFSLTVRNHGFRCAGTGRVVRKNEKKSVLSRLMNVSLYLEAVHVYYRFFAPNPKQKRRARRSQQWLATVPPSDIVYPAASVTCTCACRVRIQFKTTRASMCVSINMYVKSHSYCKACEYSSLDGEKSVFDFVMIQCTFK
jgi:hypothetical protein